MQLKTQALDTAQFKAQNKGYLLRAAVIVAIGGSALVSPELYASNLLTSSISTLPGESLNVYSGLKTVIPLMVVPAASLAAMRGGMGFMANLVGMALRAG
jgi:hypothetical protein